MVCKFTCQIVNFFQNCVDLASDEAGFFIWGQCFLKLFVHLPSLLTAVSQCSESSFCFIKSSCKLLALESVMDISSLAGIARKPDPFVLQRHSSPAFILLEAFSTAEQCRSGSQRLYLQQFTRHWKILTTHTMYCTCRQEWHVLSLYPASI